MNKKLILCAPIAMVLASCSTTHMGALVPESRETEYEGIALQGWNTGSVITYGKNYKTGYMETANVTVYQDSGIDNASKLATAAGTLAWGAGTVMSGIGAMEYADAAHEYSSAWKRIAHDGGLGNETYLNVEGSHVSGGAVTGATAIANSGASAEASAGASAKAGGPPKHPGGGMGGHPGPCN